MHLYDQHCPEIVYRYKLNGKNRPWMTKGLLNRCRMKNSLYRKFIRKRTIDTDIKYKTYKNKLAKIKIT